ncbi:MAG: ABC transporter permease [Chitinophagaceae bacterium]|nr:ABC transporter permease [Chitinophagaceae bacterium]
MIKLLQIEWLKVKTYRTFWVLFGSFVLLFPITFYFVASKYMETVSQKNQESNMINSVLGAPFVFPKIWHSASWFGGLFFIILGMLFILLVTNEVQYRTHRQNIIDGWSRTDFILAKFSVMITFILIATVLVFISGLVVGLILTPENSSSDIFEGLNYIGYFAVMAALYLVVAFLVAILIKRTGLSIIIYFTVVCIVDNLLWVALTFRGSQAGYYLPLEAADSLIPNPFKPRMMEQRTVTDMSLLLTALAYLALFGYIILASFRRTDLKT